ncbi:MAG TPA: hypothetical protein DDY38_04850 [Firmicutes bacterium]|nr:hypothetical protein [Bacillota bacterium]
MNKPAKPLYLQLSENIRQKILTGVYRPGDKIPSEREMSTAYGITRVTVRKALMDLLQQGVLESVQGKGTFVRRLPQEVKKVNLGTGSSSRLSVDIRSGGMTPSRIVLSLRKVPVAGEVCTCFHDDAFCVELTRLMLIDDTPYAIQVAHIPYGLFPDAQRYNFRDCSLYEYMESKGHRPKKILSELKAEPVPASYIRYLHIPEEKNVFSFKYFGYDTQGTLVEFTRSYNLPEYTAFKFVTKCC